MKRVSPLYDYFCSLTCIAVAPTRAARALAIPDRWKRCNRSRDYLSCDLALNLGAHTPGRNLLFAQSDAVVFAGWYTWLTGMRPAGAVVVPSPLLAMSWVGEGFVRQVPGLRAPYLARGMGAESVPAQMRAWAEANTPGFTARAYP